MWGEKIIAFLPERVTDTRTDICNHGVASLLKIHHEMHLNLILVGCFFKVINLEFDYLWLPLAKRFVWAGFMLFLSFIVPKSLFMEGFGCFFRVIDLEFDWLWLPLALSFVGAGLILFLSFIVPKSIFIDRFGCFFRVITLVTFSTKLRRGRFNAILSFFCSKIFIYGWDASLE